jgi:hypothetical protein
MVLERSYPQEFAWEMDASECGLLGAPPLVLLPEINSAPLASIGWLQTASGGSSVNTASSRDPIMNIVSGQLAEIVAGDHPIRRNGGLLWNLRIANVQHAEPLLLR